MTSQRRRTQFSRSLLMSVGLLVILAIAFIPYVRSERQVYRAFELRHRSSLLADELRQSSDVLTRMVRTYVVTGDPVYKQHYQDILDIRDGKKPRPEKNSRPYWDLVLADGPAPRPSQQAIALLELMRQAGFTEEEFRKLAEAKANSDALTVPEFEAMKLVESTGPEAEANRASARRMLYDDKYHQAKAAIMKPIDDFYVLVNERSLAAVQTAKNHATALRYVFAAFGLGLMFMLWRTYAVLREILGGSVDEIHAQIAKIGSGDFSSPIQVKDDLKTSVLGWLSETQAKLNGMDRERKRVEERLRLVVESAPNALVMVDREGRIRLVNSQTETVFGYQRDELIGQPVEILVPERFRAVHPQHRTGYFADPSTRVMGAGRDLFGLCGDGREVPIEIGLNPVVTSEGTFVLASVIDITDRKRAEAQLRETLTLQRAILDNAGYAIISTMSDGVITTFNPAAERMLGYGAEEVVGLQTPAIIHDPAEVAARAQQFSDELDEIIAPGFEVFVARTRRNLPNEYEWTYLRKDGSRFPVLLSVTALRDAAGNITGFLGLAIDITERKRAEVELVAAKNRAEAADRIKSAFLATMSHELRTPLNSIIGFTGIILQGLAGPLNPEQAKQLEMVRGSARHLLALINDVLDLSKIEAGELKVCCEPFDVRASITKVLDMAKPLAEKKGLALRAQLDPGLSQAAGDPRRVEQVLLNLLSNAIKFTERGEVLLTAEVTPETAQMQIADTGIGIKPEDLTALFEPFRQIDSGLSRNHEGTGLGLAICRRLADLMGGDIRMESEWGKGSVFTFTLPLKGPLKP